MENELSKKNFLNLVGQISQQVFSIFLIGYLFFFLIDELFDKFISNFVNLNYILIIVILSGILTILLPNKLADQKILPGKKWLNYLMAVLLGIAAGAAILLKIWEIGAFISIVVSILAGILILLISLLFLDER